NLIANETLSAELERYKEQTNVISIADSEETLMLEEESRSKIFLKQKLSDEQALHLMIDQSASSLVKIKAPQELPKVVQIILCYLDSGCSKHMTGDCSQLTNFVHKFLGIVKFGNDQVTKIIGYGDYQIGNVTISRLYYVEGLGHNLFLVGQFCDSDLKAAFEKHTCFVCNLEGVDLLSESRGTNQYSLSIRDMMASSPICLLSKDTKTKSWLWHRRLSHLKFGALNHLARNSLVRGLPRIKFEKDYLCFACAMYILVIVDDYSRFTWMKFLASKDEAPNFIIKFMKIIQVRLNAAVRNLRTDNGTEFVNQTLRDYYEQVGISHETSVTRTPQQNGVVERRNRTLVEAARTMLIYAKAPLYLWVEAVATACYTQNRSIIRHRHRKTPYELLNDRKPDLYYLYVFGALCYPNNDSENLGKLQAKVDIASVASPVLVEEAPTLVESTGLPSSTSVDQDAPSLKTISEESSSSDVISTIKHPNAPILEHPIKWTKDHLIQNIIGELSRPVKLDELGGILKNKARLVARGYRQERELILKNSLLSLLD
ncbi:retrovirus-related pol polyprotein from transposon TNT 1-94, partial [Tanacetum coccineum]